MTSRCRCGALLVELLDEQGSYEACPVCEKEPDDCGCEVRKAAADTPFVRHIKLTRASTIEPEPVVWAWEENGHGRIPAGSLSVAAGREGTGKSSFGIWMAAGITTGTLSGPMLGRPADVIYVAVEDSWKFTLVPRLMAAGADLTRVWRAEVAVSELELGTLNLPTDLSMLEATVSENGVKLIVLDPLLSLISEGIDTHKSRPVRTALDPLAALADRTGAVVLGIAHFNKGSSSDPSSLITGSGAFKDVPRSVFGFAVDPEDDSRVMTQTKNSLGKLDIPSLAYRIDSAKIETKKGMADVGKFVFDGEAARSVQDILSAGGDDGDQRQDKVDAKGFLLEELRNQWRRTAEIQDLAKHKALISERTLNRARRELNVHAQQFPTGKNGKNEWWLTLASQVEELGEPQGATETDSEGQDATPGSQGAKGDALTRADSQGANQGDVTQDWHPGTLPTDSEPVAVTPDAPARAIRPKCEVCRKAIPKGARKDAKYCGKPCQQKAYKARAKARTKGTS
ncbi:AAA family ATPase [Nonomuraea terrae]|uniref:AAA family ATPase n=1 Tax=Nonomuraea terrae TaxID=2530383 RepID=UPI00379984D0